MPPDAPLDTSARAERAAPVGFYLGKEDVLRTLTAAARTSRASYGATARLRQRIEALLDSDTVPHIEVGLVGRWAIRVSLPRALWAAAS